MRGRNPLKDIDGCEVLIKADPKDMMRVLIFVTNGNTHVSCVFRHSEGP